MTDSVTEAKSRLVVKQPFFAVLLYDIMKLHVTDPDDATGEKTRRVALSGIGFKSGVHSPAIVDNPGEDTETKVLGKAEGGVEVVLENAPAGGVYYWREVEP